MDEDNEIVKLRKHCQYLEEYLQQEISKQDSSKNIEILNDLIREKSAEILNLEKALGGCTAEIDIQERRFKGQLARAKEEEAAKLSKLLEDANQQAEVSKREKEEILAKFSQAEKMLEEWKSRVHKLEEDNAKVQRCLENSIATLNRLSMDFKNHVDRRLVIKLLVTYFQRNHSNEVLDLIVRILQFSDEEKQRIGAAQHGVVRGVLGLPGRLVGGILGGSLAESAASENQSLAALWVDFLLKETERERRDLEDDAGRPKEDSH
ncbi:golgin candidate 4-like [Quercus robur]|uniref:golgin candidate 4-like n=1 Tax=Quercus robur TaxID=38942 RepID=UPI0021618316|nr:golgin candidate 4-like [Quercus robur]XP_050272382.1 golgin candidate 4-like [Quercus robur]